MITLLAALALVIPLSGAAQVPQEVNELRALARDGPDSALVERARQRPIDARRALRQLLAGAAGGTSDSARAASLAAAHRLAGAVAVVWQDSFLVRQVAWFESLSPAERQEKTAADSLERAGLASFKRAGIDTAMSTLRESLRRYQAVADTSGMGSVLHNMAALFFQSREYDSAEAYVSQARDLAERVGDYKLLGNSSAGMASISVERGNLERGREWYARAKPIRERVGDISGLASDQMNLGVVSVRLGDMAGGRRAYVTALSAARRVGDTVSAAIILRNLAKVAVWEGDYSESAAYLRETVSIHRKGGNQLYLAEALLDVAGLALRRGDYPAAVTTLSEAGRIFQRTGPSHNAGEIDVRLESARAHALMGDLQGARTELARAEVLADRQVGAGRTRWLAPLALAGGDLESRFNRFAEAEGHYTRAQRLARGKAEARLRFRAQLGLAALLFRRERYRRAEVALEQLLERDPPGTQDAATARLLIGQAALRLGDTATARRAVVQALDTLRRLGAAPDEAEALGRLGDLEERAGRALAAESLYQHGLTRLGAQPASAVAWRLHAGLAASLRRRGALPDAARELLAGIGEIERVARSLQLEEHRSAFQADKWDVYVDLALVEYARGRTEAALEASERLRARQMLDLLARGRVSERETVQELSMREQDLRRRMGELTRQAEGPQSGAAAAPLLRDPAPVEEASAAPGQLARLQQAYGELMLEIRSADPSYSALVRGETVSGGAVMAALAPDEALLEYLVGDSTTLVFIITADTLGALDLKVSHDALAAQVDFARATLAIPTAGQRRNWRPPLRRLYRQLIGPVEASGLLAGKRRLLIAPHAELHYLPFSAMVRPGPPEQLLIERYLIEYVPSASVWMRLRSRPEPARGGGILALAPRANALPGSRREVAAIRQIYGDRAQTLVGTPATEHTFRSLAPGREIIHLATYGVLNKHNPLFSYVEMGPGGGEDGRLEVHEVFGLTLNARLLVLSACQTGLAAGALADVPPGDDWVGLVQGFLYAGASNVMATLWPVADVATARLMEHFYGELATGRSEAEALALAQRAALRDPATAHPFFWAGFAMVRGR